QPAVAMNSPAENNLRWSFFNALKLSMKLELDADTWEYNEEPHVTRRREILAKYPQIKKLMGYDPRIALVVSAEVLIQLLICQVISQANPSWGWLVLLASQSSLRSTRRPVGANRLLSIWLPNLPIANTPSALPRSTTPTTISLLLAHDQNDVDIPHRVWRRGCSGTRPRSCCGCARTVPSSTALRPFCVKSPKPTTPWEVFNFACCLAFDWPSTQILRGEAALLPGHRIPVWLRHSHPMAGALHLRAPLPVLSGQATHSYYRANEWPCCSIVGYHIEHHDFPYIPYSVCSSNSSNSNSSSSSSSSSSRQQQQAAVAAAAAAAVGSSAAVAAQAVAANSSSSSSSPASAAAAAAAASSSSSSSKQHRASSKQQQQQQQQSAAAASSSSSSSSSQQ
uniref:Lipid_DES domain-containing protein n=1 Tax=Macrostomum lignano TaxID=282301 RepID=A0A1I8FAW0_9PLAT